MTKKPRNFREYQVWQDAVAFSALVYKQTSEMPWFEKKGICDQIQCARPSDAEFSHFLDIALGSAYEVETQLLVSHKIGYLDAENYDSLNQKIISIERQITGLIKTIRK